MQTRQLHNPITNTQNPTHADNNQIKFANIVNNISKLHEVVDPMDFQEPERNESKDLALGLRRPQKGQQCKSSEVVANLDAAERAIAEKPDVLTIETIELTQTGGQFLQLHQCDPQSLN